MYSKKNSSEKGWKQNLKIVYGQKEIILTAYQIDNIATEKIFNWSVFEHIFV